MSKFKTAIHKYFTAEDIIAFDTEGSCCELITFSSESIAIILNTMCISDFKEIFGFTTEKNIVLFDAQEKEVHIIDSCGGAKKYIDVRRKAIDEYLFTKFNSLQYIYFRFFNAYLNKKWQYSYNTNLQWETVAKNKFNNVSNMTKHSMLQYAANDAQKTLLIYLKMTSQKGNHDESLCLICDNHNIAKETWQDHYKHYHSIKNYILCSQCSHLKGTENNNNECHCRKKRRGNNKKRKAPTTEDLPQDMDDDDVEYQNVKYNVPFWW